MAKKTQKQSRKDLLKTDDAFIQAANTGAEWMTDNKNLVIGAVVAIVVVVGGAILASSTLSAAADEKANALAEAMAIYDAELVPEADADPSAEPPTFGSEEARRTAARGAFEPLKGDSGTGLLAQFYAADLAEQDGDLDAAVKGFDALLAKLDPSHNMYFLAIERAAYAHERNGDLEGAVKTWARITNGEAFYRDRAAYQVARLTESQGEAKKAADLYAALEREFPESSMVASAKNRLALLKEQGVTPAPVEVEPSEPADAPAEEPATP